MKDALLIHLDYCLTPSTRINNAAIVIRDHKILAVGGYSAFVHPENFDIIEMTDCYAIPGFIDTHISGAARFSCMNDDITVGMEPLSAILAEHGVTSFLPTTSSQSPEHLMKVIDNVMPRIDDYHLNGAVPIGFHIDGPFLNMEKRGAHRPEHVKPIDLAMVREMIEASKGNIRVFTFAPELDRSTELIELLCEYDISPCMGHTLASEFEVALAVNAGANRCLHLFNGMEPLMQRKVGLAALSLIDERIWVEIIPDGIHSHWGMLELACRCKPKDKLVAISNATEAAGLPDGKYKLGQRSIIVEGGKVTLDNGTIAGSNSFLDQNYRNLLQHTELTQEEAAACCSLNAAKSIGSDDRGKIKPGKRADLVILDKEHHQVQMTIVNGRLAYSRMDKTVLIKQSLDSDEIIY
jgi:N-acetylglucosamine-6-phosphate deacetylase